ncbi:amino acid ABC transporter permease [soil metagenome]
MSEMAHQSAFVRHVALPERAPPSGEAGPVRWLRANLFNSWFNAVLTALILYILVQAAIGIFPWFANASWRAGSLQECRAAGTGACFAVINERWQQFLFGFYPRTEYWRPILAFLWMCAAIAPVLFPNLPRRLLAATALFPFFAYWLIWGGSIWPILTALAGLGLGYLVYRAADERAGFLGAVALGALAAILWFNFAAGPLAEALARAVPMRLPTVISRNIGGFTLTLVIGVSSITLSLPLGVLLALGRQSNLFFIRTISVGFIEFIRGVPLITLLFVASVMLAYLLPPGSSFDLVLRVVIMVTLFASAYIAEVIRGGLAALPRGQYEAADAMGLDYWQAMRLIVLPQALKISIPGIVNVFIGLFKDTTLVAIIGLLDPLGLTTAVRATSEWNGVIWELYGFVALIFFVFCYGMSQYSQHLERRLRTGRG